MSEFLDNARAATAQLCVNIDPQEAVDAFEFLTSPQYLNEIPTVFQRVATKILYGLWQQYPPDDEEIGMLALLERNWKIKINLLRSDPVLILLLVIGRRGAKSTFLSFIATYALFTLICKGNPQAHYGIRERHPMHIVHVAAKADQAQEIFTLTSNNIRKVAFFRPYIDFEKDTSTELRLFTPYDVELNERVKQRNKIVPRGTMKESLLPGSLFVESITTAAATNRGKSIFLLMFSELAHFQRARFDETKTDDQVMNENPQTDYALVKALIPSVKDYGVEGKVIMESSPVEKGGEFYHQYCIAAGMEQEDFEAATQEFGYQLLQLSTWEANPRITRESLEPEFRRDPRGAAMEYGAHFSNPSGQYISEEIINAIPVQGKPMVTMNPGAIRFFLAVDPGGQAKKKVADTYAIAWGHYDGGPEETDIRYWIDGMHGFDAKLKALGMGSFEKISVDSNDVTAYIVDMVDKLGGRDFITEIAYDQWNSAAPVSLLQGVGIPAIETFFTNKYKAEMYGDFLQKALAGQVSMYSGPWVDRWKLEMKYLQQDQQGNFIYYHHPDTGPVRTDDFADVVANLVHRMCLRATPTKGSIHNARKYGTGPIQVRRGVIPARGAQLWKGKLWR